MCDKRAGPPVSCESLLLCSQRNGLIRLSSLSRLKFVVGGCTARRRRSPVPRYKLRINYQAFPHDPPRVFPKPSTISSVCTILCSLRFCATLSQVLSGRSDLAASPQSHFRIPCIPSHFPALATDDIKQHLGCCKV